MHANMYPCIWMNGNAQEAAGYYLSLFEEGRIAAQNNMVINLEIMGTNLMMLNGGPTYAPNPAVSYFIYTGNRDKTEKIYRSIIKNGSVLFPLDKYPWADHYAWVQDKYGVNWQLDSDGINNSQRMVPALMFVNQKKLQVKEALEYYGSVFPKHTLLVESSYPPGSGMPENSLVFAQIKLNDYIINLMSSPDAHDFDFTPGNSIVLLCKDQQEIDYYWEALGKGGNYSKCGWLTDAYGHSWQIVPEVLSKLLSNPEKAQAVTNAFLQMSKFDIQALLNA